MRVAVSRRQWLQGWVALTGAAAAAGAVRTATGAAASSQSSVSGRKVHTVSGPIDAAQLGVTLMHEHVLVDFIGAEPGERRRATTPTRSSASSLPHLQRVKAPRVADAGRVHAGLSRARPRLLERLSEASGLHILTNTGYYGANDDKHLPPHAFAESAEQLAARWIRECERRDRRDGHQAGVHEDRRRRRAAVGRSTQAGARRGAHAQGDRPDDRRAHRRRRGGHRTARPPRSRQASRRPRSSGSTRRANADGVAARARRGARRVGRVRRDRRGSVDRHVELVQSDEGRRAAGPRRSSRTTPAGITSASRGAASSGPSTRCSRSSCLPCRPPACRTPTCDSLLVDNPRRALTGEV